MKKIICFSFLVCVLFSFTISDFCYSYFPAKKGATYELSTFNEKDKLQSRSINMIKDISQAGDAMIATISTKVFDGKGKETFSGEVTAKCENDKFYLDMRNLLSPELMSAYKDAQITFSGGNMEFPSNPEPGMTLPDAEMSMDISMSGMHIMTMRMIITDRKVGDYETITTSAGVFQCIKFTETVTINSIINVKSTSTSWMSEGVGMVKSENYDDKGKLQSYTLLTKFDE